MSLLERFKKKTTNKGEKNMTTLEEVRKAYEDLSDDDKESFRQTISDRVHESIAAQERADGTEDSQSAEAREHEALGAEHAAGKGETAELHEEDRHEDRQDEKQSDFEEWRKSADDRFSRIESALEKLSENKLDASREKYGMSAIPSGDNGKRNFSDEDVKKLLA